MSLIRFNQDITLAFISANNQDVERKMFGAGEFAEFNVQEDSTGFTLTAADGSYAPWVPREDFTLLPEGFQLYRFTKDIGLSFASYETGKLEWEENVRYLQDSVHAFMVETDVYGSLNLVTPAGRRIPGVPPYLLVEVDQSEKPSKQLLEAFPAPVPGTQFGNSWELPDIFNSLRVVRDVGVKSSLFDCSDTPVAYLRLVEGDGCRYDRLYYRCSFFGVPRRKVAAPK